MATSIVDICNMALAKLGAKPIISLTDGSVQASLCNTIAQQTVDEMLSEHLWNCAMFRQTLNKITYTNPLPDDVLQFAYPLPTNPYCLRVVDVAPYYTPYTIESLATAAYTGRVLLSSETAVAILYIGRQTDFSQLHPELVKAMVSRLKAELSYPLLANPALTKEFFVQAKDDLAMARSMDSQEGSPVRADINDLVNIRLTSAVADDYNRNWRIAR